MRTSQEYARVVYDIFPPDTEELKLIRMVVSDVQVRLIELLFSFNKL